jgi:hypothetical protein
MLLHANLNGLRWLCLAISSALVVALIFRAYKQEELCFLVGLFLFLIDAAHRYFRVRPELSWEFKASKARIGIWKTSTRLMWPVSNNGGNLMFMPAWVFGILLMILGQA